MADQWYYTRNKQQQGPVSLEQLKQLAAGGQLQPTDMIWKDGLPQWQAASSMGGLFGPAASPGGAPPAAPPQVGKPVMPGAPMPSTGGILAFLDLDFSRFVATVIVRWLWRIWLALAAIGLLVIVISALGLLTQNPLAGVGLLVAGPCVVVLYTLFTRMGLETTIILFRIAEHLREMNDRQAHSAK